MPDTPLEEAREELLGRLMHPWGCIAYEGIHGPHVNCPALKQVALFETLAQAEAVEPLREALEEIAASGKGPHGGAVSAAMLIARRALSTTEEGQE